MGKHRNDNDLTPVANPPDVIDAIEAMIGAPLPDHVKKLYETATPADRAQLASQFALRLAAKQQ